MDDVEYLSRWAGGVLEKMGIALPAARAPRCRYFERKTARTTSIYSWTTEPVAGKFYAELYRGPRKSKTQKLVKRMGFKRRWKAKARAQAWYEKDGTLKDRTIFGRKEG